MKKTDIDVFKHNSKAWDKRVETGNEWTIPISSTKVAAARKGDWNVFLTPTKTVPHNWFPELVNKEVLCLASGGGQQSAILSAAGAKVTVFDASTKQLGQDKMVAQRENFKIKTEQGDMKDLSRFRDNSFDLIVHPVSNSFVPDLMPVWLEIFRVCKPGGTMMAGFTNPILYIFDDKKEMDGVLEVVHPLPYSDLADLSDKEFSNLIASGQALEFSHTLEDQIGGQLKAGFVIKNFYEDTQPGRISSEYFSMFAATLAQKPFI